jgi:glutathione S-transferase
MHTLHYHPLSTYSQKTLMALYEKDFPFTPQLLDITNPEARAAYKKVYPLGKVPLLTGEDQFIPESSIIIEYVDAHHDGKTRLIPADADKARKTRFFDRNCDLYVTEPALQLFFDSRKPEAEREPKRMQAARERLDTMYAILDGHLGKNKWALGDTFTMADCAATPGLGLARMVHPYEKHANLTAYFGRLSERPSFQKVMAEAGPYIAKAMAAK